MKSTLIPSLLALLGFAGCASNPRSDSTRPLYVKPGLIMLTPDQADRRGIHVGEAAQPVAAERAAPFDASAVLVPVPVKAYTMGRAVDPGDANLMHEEHVVYRREASPRWRLDMPAGQKILAGPRVTDGRQEIQPLLSKELAVLLADQRRAVEANQKAIAALFDAVGALNRNQQVVVRQAGAGSVSAAALESSFQERKGSEEQGAKDHNDKNDLTTGNDCE